MRIGIYYDNRFGRNDGPPLYYFNVLRNQLQQDTYHLLPVGDTQKDVGKLDYHFWVDWGEDALGYPDWNIPKDGGKTIYVASDTHLDNGFRLKMAEKFDYVFFNQKKAVKAFKGKSYWLPHAVEPQAYPYIETIKKYDVCFIGHMQPHQPNYNNMSRVEALDKLFTAFPNFYYGTRHPAYVGKNVFEHAASQFSSSKIVFNISVGDDLNMRFWEVLATNSLLLTNWIPELKNIEKKYNIIDGVHYVSYKTYSEMIKKSKYYIKHDKKRQEIAQKGYEKVLECGTYKHRVLEIFKRVGEVIN